MVREDLLHEVADALGGAGAVVHPARDAADLPQAATDGGFGLRVVGAQAVCARCGVCGGAHPRSQKLGPTASRNGASATR